MQHIDEHGSDVNENKTESGPLLSSSMLYLGKLDLHHSCVVASVSGAGKLSMD